MDGLRPVPDIGACVFRFSSVSILPARTLPASPNDATALLSSPRACAAQDGGSLDGCVPARLFL